MTRYPRCFASVSSETFPLPPFAFDRWPYALSRGRFRFPPELKVEVMKHLPIDDLQRLGRFHGFRALAHRGLRGRVYDLLHLFHLDPVQALEMMRNNDTVLSGSAALKAVDACFWDPADLDFYCPEDRLMAVLQWFQTFGYEAKESVDAQEDPKEERYDGQYDSPIDRMDPFRDCIQSVVTLEHSQHFSRVKLVQSISLSAMAPIGFFHSTLVMNIVTGLGVVCAYPNLTLKGKGLLNRATRPADRALEKYQGRGYSFVHDREAEDDTSTYRKWEDCYAFRMRFRRKKAVGSVGADVEWRLGYRVDLPDGFDEYSPSVIADEHWGTAGYSDIGPTIRYRVA
ncbi:hypothetical protein NMY22_g7121 [Coprinellus aureogranulatus]|nr:hypothetical protein NMY22_g7121 [Coprinellus aureogranulatus]